MRIAILPTGRMEWMALPGALNRLYKLHDFYSLPTELEIESNPNNFPAAPFTTCDVTCLKGRQNNADKLIERAAAAAIGDRNNIAADLVVIIDDLEICNLNQANDVVAIMKEAANRFLQKLNNQNMSTRNKYTLALRNKVSFHLAKPMIESWLFADLSGIQSHCNNIRTVNIDLNSDPENFMTIDNDYIDDNGALCTCWKNNSKQNKEPPIWLKTNISKNRQIHPKAYLSWLCFNPNAKSCSDYAESQQGANALQHIDWNKVFQQNSHSQFVRSMIQDIADCIQESNPFPGTLAKETYPPNGTTGLLLRNV